MFVVLLRFCGDKSAAGQHMSGHQEWIRRGFDDGVFLLTGNIQPGLGGAVLAHNISLDHLENRVSADPLVPRTSSARRSSRSPRQWPMTAWRPLLAPAR